MTLTLRRVKGAPLTHKELDDNMTITEDNRLLAEQAAQSSESSANRAQSDAASAQASKNLAAISAQEAAQARDDAVAVVTGGTASIDPEAGKIPIAGAEASIKQAWIENLQFELDVLRVARNKLMYGDGPYPVLDFQFAGAKYLDPRIQFTRASKDWDEYGNEYGIDEPVLADKGLWVGGARTNLLLWSEDFTQGVWTTRSLGVTVVSNETLAPDGTMTADRVVPTITDSTHILRQYSSVTEGVAYTQSLYLKAAGYNTAEFAASTGFLGEGLAKINITTGEVISNSFSSPPKIVLFANGWVRVSVTATARETTTIGRIQLAINETNEYQGDGTSGIYVWGAQLEEGSTSTSYIPTEGSQVTVAPTLVEFTNDYQSLYIGTFYMDFVAESDFVVGSMLGTEISQVNPIFHGAASQGVGQDIRDATSPWEGSNAFYAGANTSVKKGDKVKVASGYDFYNKKSFVCVNGSYHEFDVDGNPSLTYNLLRIMRRSSGVTQTATTRSLSYYTEYLTQQQAEELTTL